MATQHALFGASSAKRLIECPGSYRLTQELAKAQPELTVRRSSVYAAEGTVAHHIAEQHLLHGHALSTFVGRVYKQDGHQIEVTAEFVEHVEVYTRYVQTLRALGYEVVLEQRVSLDPFYQQFTGQSPPTPLFGTSDCIAVHWDLQHVVVADLKFGVGVPVEVTGNHQLRYYGMGAASVLPQLVANSPRFRDQTDVDLILSTMELVIIQPRAPHPAGPIRSEMLTLNDMNQWFEHTLIPAVQRAVTTDDAPLAAGKWCQFCPVNPVCPVLQATANDRARAAFADDPPEERAAKTKDVLMTMSPEARGDYLKQLDILETHTKAVRDFFHELMVNDQSQVAGHKLVAKRATKKWVDEARVQNLLSDSGFGVHEYTAIEMMSPSKVLALPGVKTNPTIKATLENNVVAYSSGTTIAPEDDPRPAVASRTSAKDAFNDDATEN